MLRVLAGGPRVVLEFVTELTGGCKQYAEIVKTHVCKAVLKDALGGRPLDMRSLTAMRTLLRVLIEVHTVAENAPESLRNNDQFAAGDWQQAKARAVALVQGPASGLKAATHNSFGITSGGGGGDMAAAMARLMSALDGGGGGGGGDAALMVQLMAAMGGGGGGGGARAGGNDAAVHRDRLRGVRPGAWRLGRVQAEQVRAVRRAAVLQQGVPAVALDGGRPQGRVQGAGGRCAGARVVGGGGGGWRYDT
ncbi:hypothetical protein FOA52_000542 [Chlamydomonas sp. UWO 241]|nr:hypothetical protein FOA52_000542 [Chlamydomonas sp. UWO 241]